MGVGHCQVPPHFFQFAIISHTCWLVSLSREPHPVVLKADSLFCAQELVAGLRTKCGAQEKSNSHPPHLIPSLGYTSPLHLKFGGRGGAREIAQK